ncbi:MAG: Fpg/Nei family DNA glycosylase [Actinomycetes bacterium]
MPEGHTLHRLAGALNRRFRGTAVSACSPQGRFESGAAQLDGRVLERAEAYGKHLLASFEGLPESLHVHLGLYGSFALHTSPVTPPVGQVRLRLVGPKGWGDLRGPTACELLDEPARERLLSRLGPDPLRPDGSAAAAWQRISRSRSTMAALLMDQAVVAGIGNVYRAEVLFRHAVDPYLPGRDLPQPVWQAMWDDISALMKVGVRRGRILTLRAEDEGRLPPVALRKPRRRGDFYVYHRTGEPCLVCGTPVAAAELAARNLYWCPTCQPPGSRGDVAR